MRNTIIIILLTVLLSSCVSKTPQSQLSILEDNWENYLLNEEVNQEMVSYFFNIKNDGTWEDLDYSNRQRGNWPLRAHLFRTIEMAKAYQKKGNTNYHNEILGNNIILAYNWWVNEDIVNDNWWYTQIGIPQTIGLIMLLMQDEIDAQQWQKGMNIMDRVAFGNKTGQNLVWVSSNIVLRSILQADTTMVAEATSKIRQEMQMADNAEGLQPDYSFHQHGPQLQFGNYGLHFLEDQVKWMFILKGSQYNYTPEQITLMRNYFAEGQRWLIWQGVYDINSSGRQLFPGEQIKKYKRVRKAALEMKAIDPEHTELYQSISEKNKLAGAKHFPFSELSVMRTEDYLTTIRMCSSRTSGSESGNGENLSGYYLADGAMYVMQTGKEYLNIYPYWNWRKIPGTTSVQDTAKLPEIGWGSYTIASDFVGGLCYDDNTITSMQYQRDGVTANKSYFLFPGVTICLGSDINGEQEQHLQTTIEQCFSTTEIYTNDGQIVEQNTPETITGIEKRGFWHQGVGYIIHQAKDINISTENKTADWSKVLNWWSAKEEDRKVFTLSIDHGKNVNNAQYAYAVFPTMDKEDLSKSYQNLPYHILSNTAETQAVQYNNYTSIVFHKAASIKINGSTTLSSNTPAIVLCKTEQNHLTIAICDPTQKLEQAQITLSSNDNISPAISTHKVIFPTGTKKGQPVILKDIKIKG